MDSKPVIIIGGLGILYYGYTQGWFTALGATGTGTGTGTSSGTGTSTGSSSGSTSTGTSSGTGSGTGTGTSSGTSSGSGTGTSTGSSSGSGRGAYGGPIQHRDPITQSTVSAAATLAANLIAAAGVTASQLYSIDEWNYYLSKIQPTAAVLEGSSVGIARNTSADSMTAAQYAAYRTAAGLSGLGRPHGGTFGIHRAAINSVRRRMPS